MNATPMGVATYTSQLRTKINEFLRDELKACGYGELVPSYGSVLSVVYKNDGRAFRSKPSTIPSASRKPPLPRASTVWWAGISDQGDLPHRRPLHLCAGNRQGAGVPRGFDRISKELRKKSSDGFTEEEQQQFVDMMARAIENFN
jgi:hypothetical protein